MPRALFEKTGKAVWMSHLDLMRVFQRSFKRAGLPLTHTQGFNPRPSVSIALPLSVGVESVCELLDFDLDGADVPCQEICDRLVECGIKPFVDLYHWDLPQCLQERGGFVSPEFPQWFEDFARVCFKAFGDRVAFWSTFNEPSIFIRGGLWSGTFPPFGRDAHQAIQAAHNVVIAHFRAVRAYREMGFAGKIGSVNCTSAVHPARMVPEDLDAVAYVRFASVYREFKDINTFI